MEILRGAQYAPVSSTSPETNEDNSDYNATFDALLRERFGKKIAPLVVPIWDEDKRVTGIIDVLNKRAYEMQSLKRVEVEGAGG